MFEMMKILREAADVTRYHTCRVIGSQTVGHHSFNVAMLVRLITDDAASAELLRAAMNHDMPEVATGDIPAPVKWRSGEISAGLAKLEEEFCKRHGSFFHEILTDDERRVLSIADTLELVMFCIEQRQMGNRHMAAVEKAGRGALPKKPRPSNQLWAHNIEVLIGGLDNE